MGKNAKKLEKQLRKQLNEEHPVHEREMQKRVASLEAGSNADREKRADAERAAALDRALSNIPDWESAASRDLVRGFYTPLIKRDEDTGEFTINGVALDVFIASEIPDKYPNLLALKNKAVILCAKKETGGKSTKHEPIDYDALTYNSPKEDLEKAAKHFDSLLALQ